MLKFVGLLYSVVLHFGFFLGCHARDRISPLKFFGTPSVYRNSSQLPTQKFHAPNYNSIEIVVIFITCVIRHAAVLEIFFLFIIHTIVSSPYWESHSDDGSCVFFVIRFSFAVFLFWRFSNVALLFLILGVASMYFFCWIFTDFSSNSPFYAYIVNSPLFTQHRRICFYFSAHFGSGRRIDLIASWQLFSKHLIWNRKKQNFNETQQNLNEICVCVCASCIDNGSRFSLLLFMMSDTF